jgi:hypothetical protein
MYTLYILNCKYFLVYLYMKTKKHDRPALSSDRLLRGDSHFNSRTYDLNESQKGVHTKTEWLTGRQLQSVLDLRLYFKGFPVAYCASQYEKSILSNWEILI